MQVVVCPRPDSFNVLLLRWIDGLKVESSRHSINKEKVCERKQEQQFFHDAQQFAKQHRKLVFFGHLDDQKTKIFLIAIAWNLGMHDWRAHNLKSILGEKFCRFW